MEEIQKEGGPQSPESAYEAIQIPTVETSADALKDEITRVEGEVRNSESEISNIRQGVDKLRSELQSTPVDPIIPSVEAQNDRISHLTERKKQLQKELLDLLSTDASVQYKDLIESVRESKIAWAQSPELARRLKEKGVTDEDVEQAKEWLVANARGAKTFVLQPNAFSRVKEVLAELTGDTSVIEGAAFHVSVPMQHVPEDLGDSIFLTIKHTPPAPPLPGQKAPENKNTTSLPIDLLHHEFGHVTESGLLDSELFNDWSPVFKEGAPDPEYIGLINETDTRIRSMYRDLADIFDPHTDTFGPEHLQILHDRARQGRVSNDTADLLRHYSDETLVHLARTMPAI